MNIPGKICDIDIIKKQHEDAVLLLEEELSLI